MQLSSIRLQVQGSADAPWPRHPWEEQNHHRINPSIHKMWSGMGRWEGWDQLQSKAGVRVCGWKMCWENLRRLRRKREHVREPEGVRGHLRRPRRPALTSSPHCWTPAGHLFNVSVFQWFNKFWSSGVGSVLYLQYVFIYAPAGAAGLKQQYKHFSRTKTRLENKRPPARII